MFAERYPALAHLPFILDSRPAFHRLANAYLVDRGLGLWAPQSRGDRLTQRIPTKRSMHSYAQWLANFLEWSERRAIDLLTCNYTTHVAGRYQSEMLNGTWSRNGSGLAPATVNLRVQQACDFLTWMSDTRRRGAFTVPYGKGRIRFGSATNSVGHLTTEVRVRKGKVRQTHRVLHMPSDNQVKQWLQRVFDKFGPTRALMCETVLRTAMRREEVVCLRTDTLPDRRSDWHIANPNAPVAEQQVRIAIRFGTKGPSYGEDHGDKVGPPRDILIPLTLAVQWDEYRRGARNGAFAAWMKDVKGATRVAHAKNAVHLFLRETDGARITARDLYTSWTGVEFPVDGWSPHEGRHWWACSVLWRELKKHQATATLSGETATALLESTALSIIRLQIQPQLGHAHDSTTVIYLRWIMDMTAVPVSLDDDAKASGTDCSEPKGT